MLDSFAKYDIQRPVYVKPHGGKRIGSGRKHGWNKTSYPLRKVMLPPKLVEAIVEARNKNVNEADMVQVLKELIDRSALSAKEI